MLESFVIFNLQSFRSVFIHKTIFKSVINMWSCQRIPIVVFVNDGLGGGGGGGATELTAKIHCLKVHSDLIRFGFPLHLAEWDPSRVILLIKE